MFRPISLLFFFEISVSSRISDHLFQLFSMSNLPYERSLKLCFDMVQLVFSLLYKIYKRCFFTVDAETYIYMRIL